MTSSLICCRLTHTAVAYSDTFRKRKKKNDSTLSWHFKKPPLYIIA